MAFSRSAVVLVLSVVAACASNEEDVCQDIADCALAGDSDWLHACKDESKLLKDESNADGCGGAFTDFFACASDSFVCSGITPSFPGCEAKHAALDACIAAAQAKTACGELEAKQTACTSASSGSAGAGNPVRPACSVERDCEARCFLDHVKNPCAPAIDELSTVASCTAACPR
jgi:hypothetical protein